MELHATRDPDFEDPDFEDPDFKDQAPASILPPREIAGPTPSVELSEEDSPSMGAIDEALAFRDEALRIESNPPQVLDVADLSFHDESQRVASDPPQYLDVGALAFHDESQRVDSDPPRPLDPQVRGELAGGSEAAEPILRATASPTSKPTLTPERGPLLVKVKPRVGERSPVAVTGQAVGTPTSPTEDQAIGTPLRPRKLLAPREVGVVAEIDAELIPDAVHEEFAARREAQDLSVAERQSRTKQARQRSALVIGGVFAIGALMLSLGSGLAAFLVFLIDVAVGAGTGWHLGTRRPNRLVGAITAWGAAVGLAFAHMAVALALYGPISLVALFLPLVFFQALAALSGMLLSTHLESLEFDQSI